ncbi:hypothetical protein [Noviherbaspirillum galbum]|uniref:Uncharacterized protein n=1 Tax=Noviherbaspirillum galbum TaxID=2709383 RepID=A0A6B3SYX7_9BURK|nr:hypothetical protein [Noviherbaspirillum galbum]NEX63419.1 hypothetical protein [Noviherbaspirillum galbum]
MNPLFQEITAAAAESPRMFFGPVIGAVKSIIHECRTDSRSRIDVATRKPEPHKRLGL